MKEQQEEKLICPKAGECKTKHCAQHWIPHKKHGGCVIGITVDCPACIPVEPEPRGKCKHEREILHQSICELDRVTTHCDNCDKFEPEPKPEGEQEKTILNCQTVLDGDCRYAICKLERANECTAYKPVKPSEEGVEEIIEEIFVRTICPSCSIGDSTGCYKAGNCIVKVSIQSLRQSIERETIEKVEKIFNDCIVIVDDESTKRYPNIDRPKWEEEIVKLKGEIK